MDRYIELTSTERKGVSYSLIRRESDGLHALVRTRWLDRSGFKDEDGYPILKAASRVKGIKLMWVDWYTNPNDTI